jgi:imidazolonepropionase-like amidohydrolase
MEDFITPGMSLHDVLFCFADGGLTPAEVLRTATINPAVFLNKQKELGTVAVGKLADLVLLDANPLQDISNTRKINAVVANGRLLQRKDLDELLEKAKIKVKQ